MRVRFKCLLPIKLFIHYFFFIFLTIFSHLFRPTLWTICKLVYTCVEILLVINLLFALKTIKRLNLKIREKMIKLSIMKNNPTFVNNLLITLRICIPANKCAKLMTPFKGSRVFYSFWAFNTNFSLSKFIQCLPFETFAGRFGRINKYFNIFKSNFEVIWSGKDEGIDLLANRAINFSFKVDFKIKQFILLAIWTYYCFTKHALRKFYWNSFDPFKY